MDMSNFDKQFNRPTILIYVVSAIIAVLSISLLGGSVWVAWHFLSKVW